MHTILTNGRVHTVDANDRVVEAVAVAGERIAAAGASADVVRHADAQTEVIDLGGRAAVPGLIDTHAHFDREGLRRAYPSLSGCRSIADVQAVVRREAAARPAGEWIVLLPLGEPPFHVEQEGMLREGRYPDRRDLDAAAPEHPVWVRAPWGYWSNKPPFVHLLNSAALRACGIDRATTSPSETVEIAHDESGEPTGRILERYYTTIAEFGVLRSAPRITADVRRAALRASIRLGLAAGTTAIFDGHGVAAELLAVYRELHERGELGIRATLPFSLPPWRSTADVERMVVDWAHVGHGRGLGDDALRLSGVYLGYGGNAHSRDAMDAAWPYTGWGGFKDQLIGHDEYRELCRIMARHRMRVSTIAGGALAGTETLDRVLSVWEEVDREHPIADLRWVLGHMSRADATRDLPRIRRLGVVLTTQPGSYLYRSGLEAVERGIEDEWMPFRSWTEAGIPWSLSSDNKPYRMLFAIRTVMARREMREGRVVNEPERLTFAQALRAATASGAYVRFAEDRTGILAPGKLADLIVLSDDPERIDAERIADLRVDLTMVGGRIVHRASDAAAAGGRQLERSRA